MDESGASLLHGDVEHGNLLFKRVRHGGCGAAFSMQQIA